ncbi:MAG: hypothetical protein AMXMBFR84_18210 [Candidatus Hydrogenedentota bacterium]
MATDSPSEPKPPRVSIVIPSWDGHRDGCVPRLLASIEEQTFRDYEVIVIQGVSPQGRAINQGAARARGEILVILDDDSRLADEHVIERLVHCLDADGRVGMAGASIILPPDVSSFQRRAARQFPRFNTPIVREVTDSDLACHGCCAFPKSVFESVGREREDIVRGLDPDLRVRLRAAGYRVVLVPHAAIYHPMPDGWGKLIRIFFRNGYGSAYAYKFHADSVYETHEALHESSFRPTTGFVFRLLRYPFRLAKAVLQGRLIRFVAYLAYATGYLWGLAVARKAVSPTV